MSLKGILITLAVTLAILSPEVQSRPESILEIYENSPIEAHVTLKYHFMRGRDVTPWVREIEDHFHDFSFSSLALPPSLLRPQLQKQLEAYEHWEAGDLTQAVENYRIAYAGLQSIGAETEAILCLYYLAEIASEVEDYTASSRRIQPAIEQLDAKRQPYLAGLVYESQGYSLWYLDHLPGSIRSFSQAARAWKQTGFDTAILSSWNNLASLYEELRMDRRAEECYEKALALEIEEPRDALSTVISNYALFLHRTGRSEDARNMLSRLPALRNIHEDTRLAQAEVLEDVSLLPSREGLSREGVCERFILLGKLALHGGRVGLAREYFRDALLAASEANLPILWRRAALHLGEAYETQGRLHQAEALYSTSFAREDLLYSTDMVFPYFRAISPLFDGWIRCLIRTGREWEGLDRIRDLEEQRRVRTLQFLERSKRTPEFRSETVSLPELFPDQKTEPLRDRYTPSQSVKTETFTRVELWPDDRQAFIWIESPTGKRFLTVQLPIEIEEISRLLSSPFQESHHTLPPTPDLRLLQEISAALFAPCEPFIETDRLVLIPHKQLEAIPFDILLTSKGRHLGESYILSYRPYPSSEQDHFSIFQGKPVVIFPSGFEDRSAAQGELEFFNREFGDVLRTNRFQDGIPKDARWIHVSSHLRLDSRFWPISSIEAHPERVSVLDLSRKGLKTKLLSLAVCESGNALYDNSPFWMGFAGLFLASTTESVVLSRWPLDELSIPIYLDFFRLAHSGLPMDEALQQAKIKFSQRTLERGGLTTSGKHPYFWAGISYVGAPHKKIYEGGRPRAPVFLILLLAAVGCTAGVILLSGRYRKTNHQ